MSLVLIPFILIFLHITYIIICILSSKNNIRSNLKEQNSESISIEHIVCFKNETAFIKKKLEDLRELETIHKVHHTFIDDNSDDDTFELLNKYKFDNSSIIKNNTNLGKNRSQIKAVNQTSSDYILFTDANVFITGETIDRLINGFDSDTGGVTGNVKITTNFQNQDFSGKYWELEKKIKGFQTRFGSVIGFDGGLYCVKRENYNLSRENELSDFETAFLIFEQQKKTKYIHEAKAVELEARTIKNSLKSRIRACNRVFWSYYRIFKYINELSPTVLIHFLFHKIIRYLAAITYVITFPLLLIALVEFSYFLLAVFCIPAVYRLSLECGSLVIGGVIALTGKEYKTWSQAKK